MSHYALRGLKGIGDHWELINSYSASHDNWCTTTLWNRIMTAQCEGMGEVGSARYEPALLPPCPSIRAYAAVTVRDPPNHTSSLRVKRPFGDPSSFVTSNSPSTGVCFLTVEMGCLMYNIRHKHTLAHLSVTCKTHLNQQDFVTTTLTLFKYILFRRKGLGEA